MENKGTVASIFKPNIEKEESPADLGQILNKVSTPDLSNLKVAQIDQHDEMRTARPELPTVVLPDFKKLIPTFKF